MGISNSGSRANLLDSRGLRLLIVLLIFFIAGLIGGKDYGALALIGIPVLPMGLTILLRGTPLCSPAEWEIYGCSKVATNLLWVEWTVYFTIVVPLVMTPTRRLYRVLFIIFLLLIVVNIVGCQSMPHMSCIGGC